MLTPPNSPPSGSAVGLTGLTTPDSGAYNVTLDSEEPVTLTGRASFTSSEPTLLFFRTGLDPSVMHSIEVVNAGPSSAEQGAGSRLVLGAVNVTTIQPPYVLSRAHHSIAGCLLFDPSMLPFPLIASIIRPRLPAPTILSDVMIP